MQKESLKETLKDLAARWPSAWVAREEIDRFSGGVLNPKYMANLDSKKIGIEDRIRIGRKIVYPVASVLKFLESRFEAVN
jgi:hypothetical protein